ncbi:unnamed protein product [Victoria cruziana]
MAVRFNKGANTYSSLRCGQFCDGTPGCIQRQRWTAAYSCRRERTAEIKNGALLSRIFLRQKPLKVLAGILRPSPASLAKFSGNARWEELTSFTVHRRCAVHFDAVDPKGDRLSSAGIPFLLRPIGRWLVLFLLLCLLTCLNEEEQEGGYTRLMLFESIESCSRCIPPLFWTLEARFFHSPLPRHPFHQEGREFF